MQGTLDHSPADVVRKALIDAGYGVTAEYDAGEYVGDPWPVFATGEPDKPDSAITVYKTGGISLGRHQINGFHVMDHGIQVRVRAANHGNGVKKAQDIAVALDEDENLHHATVTIGAVSYWVERFERTSDVLELGKEVSAALGRRLYTVNAFVALHQI